MNPNALAGVVAQEQPDSIEFGDELESQIMAQIEDDYFQNPWELAAKAYILQLITSAEHKKEVEQQYPWLACLRSEQGYVSRAVTRYIRTLTTQCCWFGKKTLGRHLRFSDLDADEKELLQSGVLQWWPVRDAAGRAVLVDLHPFASWASCPGSKYKDYVVSLAKVLWFMSDQLLQDEATQMNGFAIVQYYLGVPDATTIQPQYLEFMSLALAHHLPTKVTSIHQCYNDDMTRDAVSEFVPNLYWNRKVSVTLHESWSEADCLHSLIYAGVLVPDDDCFLVTPSGKIKNNIHKKRMVDLEKREERLVKEGALPIPPNNGVLLLTRDDVKLGRGNPSQNFAGNVRMREAAVEEHAAYKLEKRNRRAKKTISKAVVAKVKAYGGRFLKEEEGWWVTTSKEAELTRIENTMRGITQSAPSTPATSVSTSSPSGTPDGWTPDIRSMTDQDVDPLAVSQSMPYIPSLPDITRTSPPSF